MTALHVAVRSRNASLVRYLLGKGARTDIKDAADGVVPPNPNAVPAAPAPAGGGNAAAVEEIRGLLNATAR